MTTARHHAVRADNRLHRDASSHEPRHRRVFRIIIAAITFNILLLLTETHTHRGAHR